LEEETSIGERGFDEKSMLEREKKYLTGPDTVKRGRERRPDCERADAEIAREL
jgi:hypothetical protein